MSEFTKAFRKAVKPILNKHGLDNYFFEIQRGSLFEPATVMLLNFKEQDDEKFKEAEIELDKLHIRLKKREMI